MAKPIKDKVRNGVVFTGKSWSYVLRVPDPVTGKTKPQWVGGFDTEKSAKLARDKARVLLGTDNYVVPVKLSLGDYLITWINEVYPSQLKPTSLHDYKRIINAYLVPGLGSIKLQELRPSHIQAFYSDLLTTPNRAGKPLSPSTVGKTGAVLRKALNYAVNTDGILFSNPAIKVPTPKGKGSTPTPYSLAELMTFLETAKSHRLFFYFRLSAFTGARLGELLALRWTDFDGTSIMINKSRSSAGNEVVEQNSTKGGTNGQRRVSLDPETIELFKAHKKRQLEEATKLIKFGAWHNTGYVFVREDGLPLDPKTPGHLFAKLYKRAGLRHNRPHDLRHLHATELLRLGEPLHVVAQRLGHRDAMVTATIYAHVTDQQAETASGRFANAFNA